MLYWNNPIGAVFKKREKRFFSYFDYINNGKSDYITAHCYNTGKMSGLLEPYAPSILSQKTSGKLKYTWEAVFIDNSWIGTNTSIPNKLVEDYLSILFPNETFRREVSMPGNIRVDFANDSKIIEVKNVHWKHGDTCLFPDCITARGTKQLKALRDIKDKKIYIIYVTQRSDVKNIAIAKDVDPDYYNALNNLDCTKICFNCNVNENGIEINEQIEFINHFDYNQS